MKFPTLPIACLWLAAMLAGAQPAGRLVTAQSISRQFTAQELTHDALRPYSPLAARVPIAGAWGFLVTAAPRSPLADGDKITLEPALLVVSCERLKDALLWELGLKDQWQGEISLIVNSSMPSGRGPSLTAIRHPSGWSYELELPKNLEPKILIRAVVNTLLLEMANRNSPSQSAEIPFWLAEGMSEHLQAYNLPMFAIQPNVQGVGRKVSIEGIEVVRARLREHPPLSFQQLCWPEEADLTGPDQALYRSSAQLLIENILDLSDGRACLGRMLREMPSHLNWQTAFLIAFHGHFSQLLDVEKWWGLNCVAFTGEDLAASWTPAQCWRKMQESLDVPVQVHLDPRHLPTEARLTLQEVILKWDPSDVQPTIQRAVRELDALRWRAPREVRPLVNDYLTVLLGYLRENQTVFKLELVASKTTKKPFRVRGWQKDAAHELDLLDKKRVALRAKLFPTYQVSQLTSVRAPQP